MPHQNLSKISSKIAFNKRASVPENLEIEKSYRGPVSTSFVKTLLSFWAAKLSGMKGMICIWEDMSDAMVEGQVLNFILGYLGVPMLWVNETNGKKVLAAAKTKIRNVAPCRQYRRQRKDGIFPRNP